jgi:predicted Zn-dependent protease
MRRHHEIGMRIIMLASVGFCIAVRAATNGPEQETFQSLRKQGFELHERAQFAEAIPLLKKAYRLEPNDYFVNLLLGIDLLRTGKAADAIPRLHLAAQLRPSEDIPEGYLGEAEATLGHYPQAAEAYLEAIERSHGSEESLEAWAGFAFERFRQIGARLRESEQGIAAIRQLQATASKPANSLICQGKIPTLELNLAGASRSRELNLEVETAYKLSICYAMEAEKVASRLEAAGGDPSALHRLRGDVLLRLRDDPAGAVQEYKQAIVLRPGDPALEERLAEAQLSAGDPEAAKQSAMAALALDPHRRGALRTMASLSMDTRDYEQALPWLRKLAVESPGDLGVQVELGKALAQTSHAAEALQNLQSAIAAGYLDEKGALHSLEARILRELGRDAEAAKTAAEARRLSDAFQAHNRGGAGGKPDADQ